MTLALTVVPNRAAAHPVRGRHAVPGRPQDGHALGQGRQADLDQHARRPPPLPRVRGPLAARRQHQHAGRRLMAAAPRLADAAPTHRVVPVGAVCRPACRAAAGVRPTLQAMTDARPTPAGTSTMPLLGETIDANLRARGRAVRRPRGPRRRRRPAAGSPTPSWTPPSTSSARGLLARGVAEGRPGRHLGAELRRVVARAVRHRPDRRDPGQHQPGLPHARARVRAAAGRHRRCWSRRSRSRRSDYRGMIEEVRPGLPDLRDVVYIGERLVDRAARRAASQCRPAGRRARGRRSTSTTRSTSSTRPAPPGFPKGATLSATTTSSTTATSSARAAATPRQDRICVPVPFYHCFGMVMGNLASTTHGACVVIPAPGFDPAATLRAVAGRAVHVALRRARRCSSPSSALPDFADYDLSSLRTGIMAGSPCPVEVMKRVISEMHMDEVTICYGMTETSPVSTQTRAGRLARPARLDGRPGAPARRGQGRRPGDRPARAARRAGRALHPRLLGDARLLGRAGEDRRGAAARLDAHRRPRRRWTTRATSTSSAGSRTW